MEIVQSPRFVRWLNKLKDTKGRAKIIATLSLWRLADEPSGDIKSLGKGLFEVRIHYGPGYRLYFTYHQGKVVVLLVGGNKTSQIRDIPQARAMISDLEEEH